MPPLPSIFDSTPQRRTNYRPRFITGDALTTQEDVANLTASLSPGEVPVLFNVPEAPVRPDTSARDALIRQLVEQQMQGNNRIVEEARRRAQMANQAHLLTAFGVAPLALMTGTNVGDLSQERQAAMDSFTEASALGAEVDARNATLGTQAELGIEERRLADDATFQQQRQAWESQKHQMLKDALATAVNLGDLNEANRIKNEIAVRDNALKQYELERQAERDAMDDWYRRAQIGLQRERLAATQAEAQRKARETIEKARVLPAVQEANAFLSRFAAAPEVSGWSWLPGNQRGEAERAQLQTDFGVSGLHARDIIRRMNSQLEDLAEVDPEGYAQVAPVVNQMTEALLLTDPKGGNFDEFMTRARSLYNPDGVQVGGGAGRGGAQTGGEAFDVEGAEQRLLGGTAPATPRERTPSDGAPGEGAIDPTAIPNSVVLTPEDVQSGAYREKLNRAYREFGPENTVAIVQDREGNAIRNAEGGAEFVGPEQIQQALRTAPRVYDEQERESRRSFWEEQQRGIDTQLQRQQQANSLLEQLAPAIAHQVLGPGNFETSIDGSRVRTRIAPEHAPTRIAPPVPDYSDPARLSYTVAFVDGTGAPREVRFPTRQAADDFVQAARSYITLHAE